MNPQSWVPINAPVVSILFSNFFGRTFFACFFLFLVYYENYSKCTDHEVTVKLFSEPKIFEALHQRKMKVLISHSFLTGLLLPYWLTEKQFCWLLYKVGGSKTFLTFVTWKGTISITHLYIKGGNFKKKYILWCKATNISGSEKNSTV